MIKRVIKFGIPPINEFENRDLSILFENKKIKGTTETGNHYNVNDVKVFLYDKTQPVPIFSLDFFL